MKQVKKYQRYENKSLDTHDHRSAVQLDSHPGGIIMVLANAKDRLQRL